MANLSIYDGNKELVTGGVVQPPQMETQPYLLLLELKPTSTVTIPTSLHAAIIGIDWGDNTPFDTTTKAHTYSSIKNWTVGLFLKPTVSFASTYIISNLGLGQLFDQVQVLVTPLPEYILTASNVTINISNPDFKVSNGFTMNYDWAPVFSGNLKVGFRIYTTLDQFQSFPPKQSASSGSSVWAPFAKSRNSKIESIDNQGSFTSLKLEAIYPCDFTVVDADGKKDFSGYPAGGYPRYVKQYIREDTYEYGYDGALPVIYGDRLENWDQGYHIKDFRVNFKSTSFGTSSLPSIDLSNSTELKFYREGVENISINTASTDPTHNDFLENPLYFDYFDFYYGWKIIGVNLPEGVEAVDGAHKVKTVRRGEYYHMIGTTIEEGTPGEKTSPPSRVAVPLTPTMIKTRINFSLGQALEANWTTPLVPGGDTPLVAVNTPSSLKWVKDYYTGLHAGDNPNFRIPGDNLARTSAIGGWSSIMINENYYDEGPIGSVWKTAYRIEPLPEGCEWIDGYGKNLYTNNVVNAVYETGISDTVIDVEWPNKIIIPALPTTTKFVNDYLRGTFTELHGKQVLRDTLNVGDNPLVVFTGNYSNPESGNPDPPLAPGPMTIVRGAEREPTDDDLIPVPEKDYVFSRRDVKTGRYYFDEGVEIGESVMPGLQYALNWQRQCWQKAWLDPTTVKFNPLVNFTTGNSAKSKYAWAQALDIQTLDTMPRFRLERTQPGFIRTIIEVRPIVDSAIPPHEPGEETPPREQLYVEEGIEWQSMVAEGWSQPTVLSDLSFRVYYYDEKGLRPSDEVSYAIEDVNYNGINVVNGVNHFNAFNDFINNNFYGSVGYLWTTIGVDPALTSTADRIAYVSSGNKIDEDITTNIWYNFQSAKSQMLGNGTWAHPCRWPNRGNGAVASWPNLSETGYPSGFGPGVGNPSNVYLKRWTHYLLPPGSYDVLGNSLIDAVEYGNSLYEAKYISD